MMVLSTIGREFLKYYEIKLFCRSAGTRGFTSVLECSIYNGHAIVIPLLYQVLEVAKHGLHNKCHVL